MKDFWIACGHHLLDRNASGRLVVTDEFLKAYFARPELMPPEDACPVERRLHRELLANPRRSVDAGEVAAIADPDARENWQFILAFRAELFFRPQRIMPDEHSLLLGDEEVIGGSNPTPVLSLMSMLGATTDAQVDVLSEENAESYWQRSDQFDMGLDLTAGRRAQAALAQAMTRWISHMLAIDIAIEPLTELRGAKLTWYVGLDSEATGIGDRLWHGETLDERTARRVLALFRLTFADPALAADALEREPVYLVLAMTPEQIVRMKPQNLLTGLPIKHPEAVS